MSPLLLRRYRADRLLREEFETLRERVIGLAEGRLRAAGAALDRSDLEAAYAQAWHGLHAALLDGQEIINPAGWLAVVTHRRALDEHRARRGTAPIDCAGERSLLPGRERDLADELDDRRRLRALLEALRARLSERERQAAALCYLQGLSRVEAAAQMGVSESRMRKLMDGGGKGLRGVAAKVGALVQAIAAGEWCGEQGSLMRGLAFGILDPQGDRYRLALMHSEECPACRAYVLSLRGLAVALPPVPALLHGLLGAGTAAGAAAARTLAGSGHAGATVSGGAPGVSGAQLGSGLGANALSASGAAGAGAAGGGWWLAGGVGAKLAAGCLLALGVGAGCVALEGSQGHGHARGHGDRKRAGVRLHRTAPDRANGLVATGAGAGGPIVSPPGPRTLARSATASSAATASREFGPERPGLANATGATSPRERQPAPSPTVGARARASSTRSASSNYAADARAATRASASSAPAEGSSAPAAEREFAPG